MFLVREKGDKAQWISSQLSYKLAEHHWLMRYEMCLELAWLPFTRRMLKSTQLGDGNTLANINSLYGRSVRQRR